MVLNEISRMNWIEMQFIFVVKNLTGKSGRKHAYLQYIFMNFYDKRCKLLILCAMCVYIFRCCYFYVLFTNLTCLNREREAKNFFFNKSFLWIGTFSTVCLLSSSVWNFNKPHIRIKINANDVKPMQNPISCWIAFVLSNHLQ